MQIPSWVEYEIQNWVRMVDDGPMPGPRRITQEPRRCVYPFQEVVDEERKKDPVNYERARRVDAIYNALNVNERRVVHAEYTRKEYARLPEHRKAEVASRDIGMAVHHYKEVALEFRRCVWREFR